MDSVIDLKCLLGLILSVNLAAREHAGIRDHAGLRLLVHDSNQPTFPHLDGLVIDAGYQTSISLTMVSIVNLFF